jgi:hypothetical protein
MSAFADARDRWEAIIVDDDAQSIESTGIAASDIATNVPTRIDDLYIAGFKGPIDGPGGILGSAGPTEERWIYHGTDSYRHPYAGKITFDEDDTDLLIAAGTWGDVILHEMGHVLGIGTLWINNNLYENDDGTCSSDDYLGPIAQQKWEELGCTGDLPVETDFNCPTTAGAHWDELCLDDELMTGIIGRNNYISEITIGSLEDLGFLGVDYSLADPYDLSNLSTIGCGTHCPQATGNSRRLVPGRRALSDHAAHKMECYALQVLMEARAGEQGVLPEGAIDIKGEIITILYMENDIIHSTLFSWDDVKGVVDTC